MKLDAIRPSTILRGFSTAVRTLTLLPFPGKNAENFADSLSYFPIIGAFIGGCVSVAIWLMTDFVHWTAGGAMLGVLLCTCLTRGLHLDGLADATDGWLGGQTRDQKLTIMKDPHRGTFGVAAIVLVLGLKAVALLQLGMLAQWFWIPIPFVLSRLVVVLLAVTLPYARSEGGKAELFVKNGQPMHFVVASIFTVIICMSAMGLAGLIAFLLALALGYSIRHCLRIAFDGVTGDLLGLSNELIECALLFIMTAVLMLY